MIYSFWPENHLPSNNIKIRKGHNYEGDVLYFMDSDHNVIGLLKKKTVWYIIVRAMREKVRNAYFNKNSNKSLSDLKERVNIIKENSEEKT